MPVSVPIIDPQGRLTMRTSNGNDVKADFYDVVCRELNRQGQAKPWQYSVVLSNGKGEIPVGIVFHRARSTGWDAIPHDTSTLDEVWGFKNRAYAIEYMLRGVRQKVYEE